MRSMLTKGPSPFNLRVAAALACIAVTAPACDFKSNGVASCAGAAQTSVSSGAAIGIGNTNYGGNALAQPFSVTAASSVTGLALQFQLLGPVITGHTLKVTIEGNETGAQGNQPNGAPLTTVTLSTASVTSTNGGTIFNFTFPQAVSLTAATTYWIRVQADYPVSGANYIEWNGFTGNGSPGGGLYSTSGGTGAGNWDNAAIGGTLAFYYALGC